MTHADRFQILSLDGGGVRGIFTAALLAGLEKDLGAPILRHFDLVVGTSTGGIIALGLGAGLSPQEILDFYLQQKDRIFPNPRLRKIRALFVSKYGAKGLESALRGIFGTKTLGESVVPLVITSYNLGENDVHLFKTRHHERLRRDFSNEMWAVGMATAAAPTFFPAFCLPEEHVRLIDGGVWANNPSMVGVTEAVSMFEQPVETLRLLSLGTTSDTRTRPRHLDRGGLFRWIRSPNVVNILLKGQSTGAFTQVQHLLPRDRAFRLDPPAPPELASLDAVDARELIAKASYYSRHFCPTFAAEFATHVAKPFEPIPLATPIGA